MPAKAAKKAARKSAKPTATKTLTESEKRERKIKSLEKKIASTNKFLEFSGPRACKNTIDINSDGDVIRKAECALDGMKASKINGRIDTIKGITDPSMLWLLKPIKGMTVAEFAEYQTLQEKKVGEYQSEVEKLRGELASGTAGVAGVTPAVGSAPLKK